ncbi:MAG: 4'-phosphopantetheinyl transferase superfamily protein [Rhodoferax sp.]|nr:4'-phosphopantetheinyl transferase superfamily protein [Rhodoferax sp.]
MGKDGCDSNVQLSLRRLDHIVALMPVLPQAWLGNQELSRYESLKCAARRAQFLGGHWLARQAMAQWLGGKWSDYQLSAPDDAAPYWLAGPASTTWQSVYVSLSHSGNWIACALARRPIGVDVECSDRMRDFAALGSWMFTEAESEALSQLAPALQQQTFYTQWTLKEAWFKQAALLPVRKTMKEVRFSAGAGPQQAAVAQTDGLTLALYPARATDVCMAEAVLQAMCWSEWVCTPPH